MNGVADEQGDFASGVEDVFLAGFEAWGELGQMQGPLLGGVGGGGGQSGGVADANGGVIAVPGATSLAGNNTAGVIRGAPGTGSMTGLGGSMQSFLGEAGMYPESNVSGVDSFKNGYHNNIEDSNNNKQFSEGESRELDSCKMKSVEHHSSGLQEDDFCSEEEEEEEGEEHDYHAAGEDGGAGSDEPQAESVRGLGRIFGIGTHPAVAEAQARAEALVHGRGGKSGGSAVDAAEKKRKRAVLSKEERAKQNRDRNREHARNTRLRKKAFVEELKKQVEELVAAREREERERRAEVRRESSLRDMRLQVLLTFLEYRGRAESGWQEWHGVLDDNFEMRMPITPYRTFPPHQVQGGMRVIKGVDGVLADTASLSAATKAASASGRPSRQDNIVSPSASEGKSSEVRIKREPSGAPRVFVTSRGAMTSSESCSEGSDQAADLLIGGKGRGGVGAAAAAAAVVGSAAASAVVPSPNRVYYVVDPKEVVHSKNAFMCPVLARSPQLLVPGMLRCTFSTKSNRLSSLNFSFDPTVPARQLARVSMMQGRTSPGMTGMMAGMLEMGGVEVSTAIGQSAEPVGSRSLPTAGSRSASQGGATGRDEGVLPSVLEDIREGRVSSTLVDDPKEGKSCLRVYPLNEETPGVTHFIGVLESLRSVQASGTEAPVLMAVDPPAGSLRGVPAVDDMSSSLEAGTSEGETSSDSTSSTTLGRAEADMSAESGSSGSGSGGSDDGAESRSARSSRTVSTVTTAASDGGVSSGYETRRSSRRHAAKDKDTNASSPTTSTTTIAAVGNGIGNGIGNTTIPRARARADGSKRARL